MAQLITFMATHLGFNISDHLIETGVTVVVTDNNRIAADANNRIAADGNNRVAPG